MRKSAFLIFVSLVLVTTVYSQEKSYKVKNMIGFGKEIYYVNNKQSKIKHGLYQYKYGGKVQISGQYINNNRHGNWRFSIGKSFVINAFYNNGEKDSLWTYTDDGKLISEISYKEGKKNGTAIGYDRNGRKYSNVPYKDGKIDGIKSVVYENGNINYEVQYKNDTIDGDLKYYDVNGKVILYAIYKKNRPFSIEILDMPDSIKYFSGNLKDGTGTIRIYSKKFENDSLFLISEQSYKNGLLDGLSAEYSTNGKLQFTGNYKDNFMIGMWSFYDTKNSTVQARKVYALKDKIRKDSTELYPIILTNIGFFKKDMPTFYNKKNDEFRYYVAKSLKYPATALMNNVKGKVFVQFDINETGKVINVKSVYKADEELKNEAIRVIETSPNWIPGFIDYIPCNVRYTFPITFTF